MGNFVKKDERNYEGNHQCDFNACSAEKITSISFYRPHHATSTGARLIMELQKADSESESSFSRFFTDSAFHVRHTRFNSSIEFKRVSEALSFLPQIQAYDSSLTNDDMLLLSSKICQLMSADELVDSLLTLIHNRPAEFVVKIILTIYDYSKLGGSKLFFNDPWSLGDTKTTDLLYTIGHYLEREGNYKASSIIYKQIKPNQKKHSDAQLRLAEIAARSKTGLNTEWLEHILCCEKDAIKQVTVDNIKPFLTEMDRSELKKMLFRTSVNHELLFHLATTVGRCNEMHLFCEILEYLVSQIDISPRAIPEPDKITLLNECHFRLACYQKQIGIIDTDDEERFSFYNHCLNANLPRTNQTALGFMTEQMEKEIGKKKLSTVTEHILRLSTSKSEVLFHAAFILSKTGYPLLAYCLFEQFVRVVDRFDDKEKYEMARSECDRLSVLIHQSFSQIAQVKQIMQLCFKSGPEHIAALLETNKETLFDAGESTPNRESAEPKEIVPDYLKKSINELYHAKAFDRCIVKYADIGSKKERYVILTGDFDSAFPTLRFMGLVEGSKHRATCFDELLSPLCVWDGVLKARNITLRFPDSNELNLIEEQLKSDQAYFYGADESTVKEALSNTRFSLKKTQAVLKDQPDYQALQAHSIFPPSSPGIVVQSSSPEKPTFNHKFNIRFAGMCATEIKLLIQRIKTGRYTETLSREVGSDLIYTSRKFGETNVLLKLSLPISPRPLVGCSDPKQDAYVLCFNMKDAPPTTFSQLDIYIRNINLKKTSPVIILLGLNADSPNEFWTTEVLENLSKKHNITCHTVSAKSGEGIEPLLQDIGNRLITKAHQSHLADVGEAEQYSARQFL